MAALQRRPRLKGVPPGGRGDAWAAARDKIALGDSGDVWPDHPEKVLAFREGPPRAAAVPLTAAVPPPSPTLCACRGVSEARVRVAIGGGATNIAAVGGETEAGTGCGSCRPEIAALLAAAAAVVREAEPARCATSPRSWT